MSKKPKYVITNYYTFTNDAVLTISPNPASSEVNVTYGFTSHASNPTLLVTDITGKILSKCALNQENNKQVIPTYNLQQGIYYLQLMDGSERLKSVPLIVIH